MVPEKGGSSKEKKEQPGTLSRRDFLKFGLTFLGALALVFCPGCGPMKDNREQKDNPDLFNINLLDPESMKQNWRPSLKERLKQELPELHHKLYEALNEISRHHPNARPFGSAQRKQTREERNQVEKSLEQLIDKMDLFYTQWLRNRNQPYVSYILWLRYRELASWVQIYIDTANATKHYGLPKTAQIIYDTLFSSFCQKTQKSHTTRPIRCRITSSSTNPLIPPDLITFWNLPFLVGETLLPITGAVFMLPRPDNSIPYQTSRYLNMLTLYKYPDFHKPLRAWAQSQGWPKEPMTQLNIIPSPMATPDIRAAISRLDLEQAFGLLEFEPAQEEHEAETSILPDQQPPIEIKIYQENTNINDPEHTLFAIFHELFHYLYDKALALDEDDFLKFQSLLFELYFQYNPFRSTARLDHTISHMTEDATWYVFGYPLYQLLATQDIPRKFYVFDKEPTLDLLVRILLSLFGFDELGQLFNAIEDKNDTIKSIRQRSKYNKDLDKALLLHLIFHAPNSLINIQTPNKLSKTEKSQLVYNIAFPLTLYIVMVSFSFEETLANIFGQVLSNRALNKPLPLELAGADKMVDNIIQFLRVRRLAMQQTKV